MGSQRVVRVETPVNSSRKRHVSVPSDAETEADLDSSPKRVRRSLNSAPDKAGETVEVIDVESVTQKNANSPLEHLIKTLSADMHMMFSALTERVDKLESGLEQRISNKVAQLLDKRVNTELNRIKKDVDTRLDSFKESLKDELAADLADINAKLESVTSAATAPAPAPAPAPMPAQTDRSLNVVIRGLPVTNNENVKTKVNALIKDGLRIRDVTCNSAERKTSYNEAKPGVIIASFSSHEDKRKVMQKKVDLKYCRQYDNVFIQHDLSQPDRILSNNFRTILSALREQNLTVRGTRVVQLNRENRNDSSRNNERFDRDSRDRPHNSARGNSDRSHRSHHDRGDNWQTVRGYGGQSSRGSQHSRHGQHGPHRYQNRRS